MFPEHQRDHYAYFLEALWNHDQSHHFVVMGMEEVEALAEVAGSPSLQLNPQYGRIVSFSRQEAELLLQRGKDKGHYPPASQLVEERYPQTSTNGD